MDREAWWAIINGVSKSQTWQCLSAPKAQVEEEILLSWHFFYPRWFCLLGSHRCQRRFVFAWADAEPKEQRGRVACHWLARRGRGSGGSCWVSPFPPAKSRSCFRPSSSCANLSFCNHSLRCTYLAIALSTLYHNDYLHGCLTSRPWTPI